MRRATNSADELERYLGLPGGLGSPYASSLERRRRAKVLLAPISSLFGRVPVDGLPIDGFLQRNDIEYVFELVVKSKNELSELPDPSGYHPNYWLGEE